ncbi:MAG TPA: NAD(P)H-dependent oxidoreductase [Polyangia bacterium]|nr:NAD(P)H-dependent oxidoreductase [Polyangia bacterium]
MLKLQVIVGSTRPGRSADLVMRWLAPAVRAMGAFEVELLDLRDWPLPIFQETIASLGDFKDPSYSEPLVKRWNHKIKEADAYLVVTPEYNHSAPAVLKNAIDSVFFSFGFRHKAVAFVGYSAGVAAGVRAVEHLNQIMLEAEAVPIRTQTLIPYVGNAFDAEGRPSNPALDVGFTVMLEDLAWMAGTLKAARAEGEPAPANLRIRAAMTKK